MRQPRRATAVAVLVALAAGVAATSGGCGYALVDERAVFGPDVRTIYLEPIENRTTEVGLEAMLVDALQEEFTRRGVLVPRYERPEESVGLALGATIVKSDVLPTAFSSVALTLEDSIAVTLSFSVRRLDTGDTVLALDALPLSERFLTSADPQVYESNKEQALRSLAARFASQLHDVLFQQPF